MDAGSVDDFEVDPEEGQPIVGTYTLTCEHVEKLNTALLDRYKDQKNVITTPLVRGLRCSVLLCGALGSASWQCSLATARSVLLGRWAQ